MERHISGHVARAEKESREIDGVFIQKMMYILNAADERYEILKQLFVQIFKDHVVQVQNRHHVMSLVRHVLSVNKNLKTRCVDFKLFVASLWTQMEEQEQKDLVGIEQEMSEEMEEGEEGVEGEEELLLEGGESNLVRANNRCVCGVRYSCIVFLGDIASLLAHSFTSLLQLT